MLTDRCIFDTGADILFAASEMRFCIISFEFLFAALLKMQLRSRPLMRIEHGIKNRAVFHSFVFEFKQEDTIVPVSTISLI
jgi:hypothetical protein